MKKKKAILMKPYRAEQTVKYIFKFFGGLQVFINLMKYKGNNFLVTKYDSL